MRKIYKQNADRILINVQTQCKKVKENKETEKKMQEKLEQEKKVEFYINFIRKNQMKLFIRKI